MIWQDAVISMGSLIGTIAIVPMLFSKQKPPLATSLPTAIVLTIFIPAYISLGLLATMTTVVTGCLMWWVLVIQNLLQRRHALASSAKVR